MDNYQHKRLLFHVVEWNSPIVHTCEINFRKINPTNGTVVHRAIIDNSVCDVCNRSPLCGTGNVDRYFAIGKLHANGDIEIIQYLEPLTYSIFRFGLQWRCCLIESGTNETRRGVTSPGIPKEPLPAPKEAICTSPIFRASAVPA